MKRFLILSIGLLGLFSLSFGQDASQKTGMTGAKFLAVPVGARATAMGEAFAGIADDGSAVFWNVAGMALNTKNTVYASHTNWVADIVFNAVAVNLNLGRLGKIGVNYQGMNVGDMRVRTPYALDGTGELFTVMSMASGASWAKSLTDQFSMGMTVKYIREEYDDLIAEGWALDIGSLYDTRWHGLKIGMSMTNFGPDIAFDGSYNNWTDVEEQGRLARYDDYAIPLTFRFGIAMDALEAGSSGGTEWVMVVDAIHPPDNSERVNFGTEVTLMNMLAVRAGYALGADEGGLSAGLGLLLPMIGGSVDMSYTTFGLLGNITNLSIGLNF